MFYQSVVAVAIFHAAVCRNINKHNKLVRKAGSVIGGGVELDSLEVVMEKRILSKLASILNVSHPLHDILVKKKNVFSQRLEPRRFSTERLRDHSCRWPVNY